MANQRGQAITEAAIAIILILATISTTLYTISDGNRIFVGDNQTKLVYEYSSCSTKINEIPENRRIIFESLKKADDENYLLSTC